MKAEFHQTTGSISQGIPRSLGRPGLGKKPSRFPACRASVLLPQNLLYSHTGECGLARNPIMPKGLGTYDCRILPARRESHLGRFDFSRCVGILNVVVDVGLAHWRPNSMSCPSSTQWGFCTGGGANDVTVR